MSEKYSFSNELNFMTVCSKEMYVYTQMRPYDFKAFVFHSLLERYFLKKYDVLFYNLHEMTAKKFLLLSTTESLFCKMLS